MRFGCCPGLASFVPPTLDGEEDSMSVAHAKQCERIPPILELLAEAGFDYVEFGVGTTAPEQPEADFRRFLDAIEGSPLKAEVFSSFIPPWIRVVGPEADWARIDAYLTVAVERVARAGGDRIIFGSGGARTCPEGFPLDAARDQLLRFLNLAGDHCERHGIVLCIEPLNASETNMINKVAEATAWAREISRPCVQVLADCFHMGMENESYESIVEAGALLKHAHVADQGRRYPADFGYDIDGFFGALKQAGYDGRVSIEANFADLPTEAPAGLERIKRAAG
ncbi:MAG: sugar phosphate isomerase/epimerase [Armatimonadetes bacterium]|nr:sugar phosphate isomerase/epimerase [Armatimonadota bacterium]